MMKKLLVKGNRESEILIGERLENLSKYIPSTSSCVIITDTNVRGIYGNRFVKAEIIEIGMGEKIKTLDTVREIYEKLIKLGVDRSWYLVGIGGGIVCDIAGFVASSFMRGLSFGFVSTTLLSQVDASVGGKNGVNFDGFKNMIGVFSQPDFVICDMEMLKTLPEDEVLCGMAEIIKHALIANAEMFTFLEDNYEKALSLNKEVIERLVSDSIYIKSTIVNMDEKEKGERRKLNFGHTFGHAVEKLEGVSHGRAVGIGMVIAAEMSLNKGLIRIEEFHKIILLLENMGLAVATNIEKEKMIKVIYKDKKREGDGVHFVLLNKIGDATLQNIPLSELTIINNQ